MLLELDNDVLTMFTKWFWSIILSVRTVTILVFSRNSNFTLNYSLGTHFLIEKKSFQIGPKMFLELHNDVLTMFTKWFWSIILSVRTVTILVFSRNSNFTLNYSLGTHFLIEKKSCQIGPKMFLELHNDVLVMFLKYFWSKMLFVGTVSILVFSWNSNRTMNYIALVLIFSLQNQSFQIGPKLS